MCLADMARKHVAVSATRQKPLGIHLSRAGTVSPSRTNPWASQSASRAARCFACVSIVLRVQARRSSSAKPSALLSLTYCTTAVTAASSTDCGWMTPIRGASYESGVGADSILNRWLTTSRGFSGSRYWPRKWASAYESHRLSASHVPEPSRRPDHAAPSPHRGDGGPCRGDRFVHAGARVRGRECIRQVSTAHRVTAERGALERHLLRLISLLGGRLQSVEPSLGGAVGCGALT